MFKPYAIVILLLFSRCQRGAAQLSIDSLKTVVAAAKTEMQKASALNALAEMADNGEWQTYNEQLYVLSAEKIKTNQQQDITAWETYYANSCINKGLIEQELGHVNKALAFYEEGYRIHKKNNNIEGIANATNNLGFINQTTGNIPKAMEYFTEALKVTEKLKNKFGEGHVLINLGYTSALINDTASALKYYLRSVAVRSEIGDSLGLAQSYSNIGALYNQPSNYHIAKEYYNKSFQIRLSIRDKAGLAVCYGNFGALSLQLNKLDEALTYFDKQRAIGVEINSKEELCASARNTAKAWYLLNNTGKAEAFALEAYQLANEIHQVEEIMETAELLYKLYRKQGKHRESLKMFKRYLAARDTIINEANHRSVISTQLKYEYEKKALADSLKNANAQNVKTAQLKAQEAQIRHEKFQRYGLIGGFLLLSGGLVFVISRYRVTARQKSVIESQKLMVDTAYEKLSEKNREVMDSIHYAKRIQTAMVTSEKYIDRQLRRLRG